MTKKRAGLWQYPVPKPLPRQDGAHDWKVFGQYTYPVCRICGVVKRRDGKNQPCKGPTRLRPMEGETPKALDSIVDVVLAYRPKARSQPAIQRKRRATKIAKGKK